MKAAWVLMGCVGGMALLGGCVEHDTSPVSPGAFALPPQLPLIDEEHEKGAAPAAAPVLPGAFGPGSAEKLITWRCTPAQDLIAAFPNNRVRLWSTLGYYELTRVAAADGAKYQEGDIVFWNKGREALIGNGDREGQCQADAERSLADRNASDHVSFHALGRTPAWTLTLADDTPQVVITLNDNGQRREVELPYDVLLNRSGHKARFIAAGHSRQHDLRVEIEAGACFDRMDGKPYPARVALMLDGTRYEGCGETLD